MLGGGATFCSLQAGNGEASCGLPGRASLGGTAAQGTFCQRSSRIANKVLEAWFLIRSTLAFSPLQSVASSLRVLSRPRSSGG